MRMGLSMALAALCMAGSAAASVRPDSPAEVAADTVPVPVSTSQSVGLVLSGGGAKGIAEIGAIQALEDNVIPIE